MKPKIAASFLALSLLAALSLFSTAAKADPVCGGPGPDTVEQCRALQARLEAQQAQVDARLWELLSGTAPRLDAIVERGHEGCPSFQAGSREICHMNQIQADHFCRSLGTRLPTARDQALISQSLGACGILSTIEYDSFQGTPECPRDSYDRVSVAPSAQEPSGDEFYYSRSGYRRSDRDLGNYFFWSSSVSASNSNFAYGLGGDHGDIYGDVRRVAYTRSAVRCVQLR